MKRLSLIGSWKRIGVQAGLLAGIGLAFVGGSQPPNVGAEPPEDCKSEDMCSFKKPLFLIILDYSTSMNKDFMGQGTRWENAVSATKTAIDANNGFLVSNFIIGLMRFGHDPNPNSAGTTIPSDTSGIVDGQKVDVEFYDKNDPAKPYFECEQGDVIKAALDALPAPINGNLVGIGTWTRGALLRAEQVFDDALANHPMDGQDPARLRSIMLVTDGEWTNPQGNMPLNPPAENPAPQAANLFNNDQIPTYVVAIGEAMGKAFADELANAGGTGTAYDAANPQALVEALAMVVQDLINMQVSPICTPGLPRIMVLLDASSSMLNLMGGATHAGPGQGGWEAARDALAGDVNAIFLQQVSNGQVEDLVHLGLAVFGGGPPQGVDESDILVQYGPCRRDNFKWALDPQSSCIAPGCNDPYAPAPITWTYQDGTMVPPNFDEATTSHMPLCNQGQAPNMGCFGSGTMTHLGLLTIQSNINTYKGQCNDPNAQYPCSDATQFINIIITDGVSNSTDAQLQPPLTQMYNAGITSYVIGLGDGVDTPAAITHLNKLADWGSGNMLDYYDANNQVMLQQALADIIEGVSFDPCCKFNDCGFNPEPQTDEPDPVVNPTSESESTTDPMTSGTTDMTGGTTDTTGPVLTTDMTTAGPTSDTDTSAGPTSDPDTSAGPTSTPEPDPTGDPPTTTAEPDPMTTNPSTNPTNNEPDPDDETTFGSSSSGGTTEGVDDEGGCGCKTDDAPRGLLGTLLSFGLAGFIRRRRRA